MWERMFYNLPIKFQSLDEPVTSTHISFILSEEGQDSWRGQV